jgi:hypothetical protein
VVPDSFRLLDPSIASDEVVGANVDLMGDGLDVDGNEAVAANTDGVYVFRRLLGLGSVVPQPFRDLDPTIPSDQIVGGAVDDLCP